MTRFRTGWLRRRGLCAGVAVLAAGSFVVSPVAQADPVDLTTVVFTAVEPDGSPVARPFVLTSVLGSPEYGYPSARFGGAAGEVVVPLPTDDPYVAQQIATGAPVNLLVRVYDAVPTPESGANAAYVVAAIDPGLDGVWRVATEVSATGKVTLAPGLSDYQATDAGAVVGVEPKVPDVDGLVHTVTSGDRGPCPAPRTPNNMPTVCSEVDYPSWVRHVYVPIAYNHGGGADFASTMEYHSTYMTKAGVAVNAGKGGFVAANGSVDYVKEVSDKFGFGTVGPRANMRGEIETVYQRSRSGTCFNIPSTGQWYCQIETRYEPYMGVGSKTEREGDYHDKFLDFGPYLNAWKRVRGYYESEAKSEFRGEYSLTLGSDENWADPETGLYANTTITGQTHTGKGFVHRWTVVGDEYPQHYLWVPLGDAEAENDHRPGGGAYVDTHVGDAWTWATDTNLDEPYSQGTNPVPTDPDDPVAPAHHQICGHMPDRCD